MHNRLIKIVFFGTPEYAVPALRKLAADPEIDVALVVTQPDRQAGRGHAMSAPPVKIAAIELGLPVLQPPTLRDENARETLRGHRSDLFVVAAYGLIFSQAVLDIPHLGCLNLHASLLPRFRGAAPIPAAILSGDERTGVTLMMMERGLDTGPMVATAETDIRSDDTTETLTIRLAHLGADLAAGAIPLLVAGDLSATPQPGGASVVRQLTKADGEVKWGRDSKYIERQVRAMWPWPRAWTRVNSESFQIHAARIVNSDALADRDAPGRIAVFDGRPAVQCGDGRRLEIEFGQIAGGKRLAGTELVRGRVLQDGMQCTSGSEPADPLIREVAD